MVFSPKRAIYPLIYDYCDYNSILISDKISTYVNSKTDESHLENISGTVYTFFVSNLRQYVNDLKLDISS